MKIEVYDINKLIEKEGLSQYEMKGEMVDVKGEKLAIIEYANGYMVADYEAVARLVKTENDTIKLDLRLSRKEGTKTILYPFVSLQVDTSIAEIKAKVEPEIIHDDKEFFTKRDYNTRTRSNYHQLMELWLKEEGE